MSALVLQLLEAGFLPLWLLVRAARRGWAHERSVGRVGRGEGLMGQVLVSSMPAILGLQL